MACVGIFITDFNSIANKEDWIGKWYQENAAAFAILEEPLTEKPNSYKAEASITRLLINDTFIAVKGKIILYLEKDSSANRPGYGSQIVFKKKLQSIRNSGNPGAFDYRRYCEFQGIHYQVYLKTEEFRVFPGTKETALKKWVYMAREKVLEILRSCIEGKKEIGVAEALLIGYRNDLDKDLVQAYSNTGVVHIIAISGLHLGLIYGVLLFLLKPLSQHRHMRGIKPVLIIVVLWLFSLLSGASASVLRSAVMFTVLAIGECRNKETSSLNSLAASAFLLLGYDPFYLWDVGFQLSYAAVLSILLFMKPIDNWFYFSNKLLQKCWKLNAVTLSAQVLTVPMVMYHFHQFPTLFLFTNLIAVPLSSVILLGEILLCTTYFIPPVANLLGSILQSLIRMMNEFIEKTNSISFSVIQGIQLSIPETIFLYGTTACFAWWLLQKSKTALFGTLISLLIFFSTRIMFRFEISRNRKMIVYNIPKQQAIDFIQGKQYFFKGDSVLLHDQYLQNFYLKPARTLHFASKKMNLAHLYEGKNCILFGSKRIFLIDETFVLPASNQKIKADLIILSKNTRIRLEDLSNSFSFTIIIADASNALWKIQRWKSDAERLHLRFHSVPEQGAFVLDS